MARLPKVIYRKGKEYFLYDTYDSYAELIRDAKYYKKKNRSRYIVLKFEKGFWFPYKAYALYMDKIMRLWQ